MEPTEVILQPYQAAIDKLKQAGQEITAQEVLDILNARDALQRLLDKTHIPTDSLKQVIDLDTILREKAEQIVTNIKIEQLQRWRDSVHPPVEAWWWYLEKILPTHKWDRLDWLWKGGTVVAWTVNLSLLVNLGTRFFGSGGVGLAGASAIILPSLIALLQASSELTTAGKQGFEKILNKLNIPLHWREEVRLGSTALMSVILFGFWFSLPQISKVYNRSGISDYKQGKLGAAEQNYLQAISLNTDNLEAHYNLANIYEDLQDLDKAQKHYQIAVKGEFPQAYNNLARLYIQKKQYSQAFVLLKRGVDVVEKTYDLPEVRYSLYKNLGWARFKQSRYQEAQKYLLVAIEIAQEPDKAQFIRNRGSAYCLSAQVLDSQKPGKGIEQWQKCCQLADTKDPNEDKWLHLGEKQLKKVGKKCEKVEDGIS